MPSRSLQTAFNFKMFTHTFEISLLNFYDGPNTVRNKNAEMSQTACPRKAWPMPADKRTTII